MATLIQKALLTLSAGLVYLLAVNTPVNKESKLNLEQYNLNKLFEYEISSKKDISSYNLKEFFNPLYDVEMPLSKTLSLKLQ